MWLDDVDDDGVHCPDSDTPSDSSFIHLVSKKWPLHVARLELICRLQ